MHKKVINDMVGGTPLLIVYEPKQDMTDVLLREVHGKILSFQQKGDGERLTLVERESGLSWDLNGLPRQDNTHKLHLEPYPHFNRILWFSWVNFHPETELYSGTDQLRQSHE